MFLESRGMKAVGIAGSIAILCALGLLVALAMIKGEDVKQYSDEVFDFVGYEQRVVCAEYGGIDHPNAKGCCAEACGRRYCGTADCAMGPGGPNACCEHVIQQKFCSPTQMAPCMLNTTHMANHFQEATQTCTTSQHGGAGYDPSTDGRHCGWSGGEDQKHEALMQAKRRMKQAKEKLEKGVSSLSQLFFCTSATCCLLMGMFVYKKFFDQGDLRKQGEDLRKEINARHANLAKETSKRLHAVHQRISKDNQRHEQERMEDRRSIDELDERAWKHEQVHAEISSKMDASLNSIGSQVCMLQAKNAVSEEVAKVQAAMQQQVRQMQSQIRAHKVALSFLQKEKAGNDQVHQVTTSIASIENKVDGLEQEIQKKAYSEQVIKLAGRIDESLSLQKKEIEVLLMDAGCVSGCGWNDPEFTLQTMSAGHHPAPGASSAEASSSSLPRHFKNLIDFEDALSPSDRQDPEPSPTVETSKSSEDIPVNMLGARASELGA